MADERSVPHDGKGGHGHPDKSPKVSEETDTPQRAEVSNYEIVEHWFTVAAERLGLRDDVAAVLRSSYREVQVQVPVKLSDDRIHVLSGFRVQHTVPAARTRAASASTPRSTSTRCGRSPSS
jgi:hypothetical protein